MLVAPGTIDLLHAAMASGADLIGGGDPAGFDGDPVEHLDTSFGIADPLPLDLLDEHGAAVCLGQDGIRSCPVVEMRWWTGDVA